LDDQALNEPRWNYEECSKRFSVCLAGLHTLKSKKRSSKGRCSLPLGGLECVAQLRNRRAARSFKTYIATEIMPLRLTEQKTSSSTELPSRNHQNANRPPIVGAKLLLWRYGTPGP
jgi:hypothetical protein